MRKLLTILSILAILGMIGWKLYQPIREKKARQKELLLTSDAANLDRIVRIWGDDWLGYMIFRSRRFQSEMQRQRLGVRYELVFDFKERFRGLAEGKCDLVAATIDSYLANGHASGFPGVISWVIDESYGADAIVGGPKVTSVDALNQPDLKGALVGFSPSEFLLKAQVANFRLNTLLPRVPGFRVDQASTAYDALAKGKVDFAVLWEPFTSQALAQIPGTKRLIDTSETRGVVVDVAITSRKFLAEDPKLIEKIGRCYFATLSYYLQHADEFRELAAADSKQNTATATTMLNGIKFASLTENSQSWFALDSSSSSGSGNGLFDSILRIGKILADVGDLKSDPLAGNPYSIIYSKALKDLQADRSAEPLLRDLGPVPDKVFFRALQPDEWTAAAKNVVGTLIDEPIIFGSGSAGIADDFQARLQDAVARLAQYPKYRVVVAGYVSPGDDPKADQQLSEDRARVVKRYLVETGGVQEERILALGLGAKELPERLPEESDAAWKRRCRRARITLVQEK